MVRTNNQYSSNPYSLDSVDTILTSNFTGTTNNKLPVLLDLNAGIDRSLVHKANCGTLNSFLYSVLANTKLPANARHCTKRFADTTVSPPPAKLPAATNTIGPLTPVLPQQQSQRKIIISLSV